MHSTLFTFHLHPSLLRLEHEPLRDPEVSSPQRQSTNSSYFCSCIQHYSSNVNITRQDRSCTEEEAHLSVMSDSATSKDNSPLGFYVHGILQARIMEWVAVPSSRGASQSRDRTRVSCIAGRFFTTEPPGKPYIEEDRIAIIAFTDCLLCQVLF